MKQPHFTVTAIHAVPGLVLDFTGFAAETATDIIYLGAAEIVSVEAGTSDNPSVAFVVSPEDRSVVEARVVVAPDRVLEIVS